MVQSTAQASTTLLLQDPLVPEVTWKLMVSADKQRLFYATCLRGITERLRCLLSLHQVSIDAWPEDLEGKDYPFLYQQMFSGPALGLKPVRELLLRLTQEAFTHCLLLRQFQVKPVRVGSDLTLSPVLLDVPLDQVMAATKAELRTWMTLRPKIPSPFSYLHVDAAQISDLVDYWHSCEPTTVLRQVGLPCLTRWGRMMQAGASLYALAAEAGLSPTVTAQSLFPVVQSKLITVRARNSDTLAAPSLATICCIDDSKAIIQNVSEILSPLGYRVVGVQDPKNALAVLEEEAPHLVLLDILMPEVDGYELCRMMRQSHLLREIPIVFLTGKDGLFDKLRARVLRVREYMTKPVDPNLLRECVERVLQSRELPEATSQPTKSG